MILRTELTNNQIPGGMVTMEKKLFTPSFTEMVYYTIMMLVLLNGAILLLFPMILKVSYIATFQRTWIMLVFTPLLTGIIQPLINRNGLLTLKGNTDTIGLQDRIAESLSYFDYLETGRDDHTVFLDYRTKWKRFMHFYKGGVSISIEKDEIRILGKRQILDFLETKLIFGKNFKTFNAHKLKI